MKKSSSTQQLHLLILTAIVCSVCYLIGTTRAQGSWQLLLSDAGIASMHTAVTHYGNVVFLDRTNIGPSQINLTGGLCRENQLDLTLTHDCTAHSVLFSPPSNTVRPLFIFTDTWCSSGQFFPDGTLVQTGGDNEGLAKVRRFKPCPDSGTCDWEEATDVSLIDGRWYATNQLLPDGRQIVVGGRSVFTYEFIPPLSPSGGSIFLPFLNETNDQQQDNLYPFVHLLPDGNLFIFANHDSIIYNYSSEIVVKKFPSIPGEPRNYPSAGSSVMLPLTLSSSSSSSGYGDLEVLICGGAQMYCFLYPAPFPNASQTCGRIRVYAENPSWEMETMPIRRAMGDMIYLANGNVLIVNGAQNGCQGWGNAINPALNPVIYIPDAPSGSRFYTQNPSTIPRVYHSTANLLPDGRVLIAGSNTHQFYTFTGDFPTELRVEAFSPSYLDSVNDSNRPVIAASPPDTLVYGQGFSLTVTVNATLTSSLRVNLVSSPFTTHSYSQGLRFLRLEVNGQVKVNDAGTDYALNATAPPSATLAPPAYYMLFVENNGIPSSAVWVRMTYSSSS